MAILLCNHCSYLREVPDKYVGKTIKCPICKQSIQIHNVIAFVKNVLTKYKTLHKEYCKLKGNSESLEKKVLFLEDENIDFHNTSAMTSQSQFKPIKDWFDQKRILLDINTKALDTQGFFDEIAVALGDNYELLKDVNDRIKKAQRKGYNSVTLAISKHSQKEIQSLTKYCKELYDFSFVAKYYYNKSDKRIHLTLQKTPSIINFFNGEWLEWFVFMKLLILFYEKKILFSALRSFMVNFPNEDKHEVDVFFLINNKIPLFIECKTGEFRSTIEKYHKLRKRMGIEKKNFVMLVLGLSEEQSKGLTSMYDISFVNEKNFIDHFLTLL
jgi:flavodoxin